MKTITGLLILIGLINCASKPTEMRSDICTEKYFSNKWKVTVYHSKDWSPYEFYGNNIGLEYKGLQNFERRYEAETAQTQTLATIGRLHGQTNFKYHTQF